MRKLFLILHLELMVFCCLAQGLHPSDSLQVIRIVDEMLDLKNTDIKKQDSLINQAITVAGKINRKDYQLKLYNLWSVFKLHQNEFALSRDLAQKALQVASGTELEKTVWYRDAITQMTLCYHYLGYADSSMQTGNYGKRLCIAAGDDFNRSVLLSLEAINQAETWPAEKVELLFDSAAALASRTPSPHDDIMAGYNKASFLKIGGKKDWVRSIEALTSLHTIIDHPDLAVNRIKPYDRIPFWFRGARHTLYRELSQIYFQLGDIGDACFYQEQIVNEYKRTKNFAFLPYAWCDLAEYETFRNDYEKVQHIYDSSRLLIQQIYKTDEITLPSFFYAGGWLAEKNGDHREAIRLYQKAIQASRPGFHVASLALFRTLVNQGRADEAGQQIPGIDSVLNHEFLFYYRILFKQEMANYLRSIGKEREADKSMLEFYYLKDSMTTAARYFVVRESEMRFRTAERERELALLNKEKEIQQKALQQKTWQVIFLVGGLIFLLITLLLLFWFYKNKKQQANILKQKNKQIETLIRELHHRVKNNLQVVSSLMSLQSNRLEDNKAREALEQGRNRVDAMAMIHQKLYMDQELASVDISEYLRSLAVSLAYSFGFTESHVSVNVDMPDNMLDIDRAIPIGLIVNELVTNAFKHGISNEEEPHIRVSLSRVDSDRLELRVADNGPGIKEGKIAGRPGSFGMKLVQTLVVQLNGDLQVIRENGTVFKIEIRA